MIVWVTWWTTILLKTDMCENVKQLYILIALVQVVKGLHHTWGYMVSARSRILIGGEYIFLLHFILHIPVYTYI